MLTRVFRLLGLFMVCVMGISGLATAQQRRGNSQSQTMKHVWIGTSRANGSQGIYHTTLNLRTGRLGKVTLMAEVSGPGFLTIHPELHTLYAVGSLEGKPSLIAYAISENPPRLELRNAVEIGDGGAAHVCVDRTGRTALTAQYGGGSVAVFSLKPDGSIDKRTQVIEHQGGSMADPRRQKAPHPHWVGVSPDNRFAFVPDLGLDQVVIYELDANNSKLKPHGTANLPPGAGPRHMKFHTLGTQPRVYVLHELDLSVSVFDYDADHGTMERKQTMPTVPKEQLQKEPFKSCSEIRVHPSGKFIYAANRGHDTITVFRVDGETGEISVVEREFVRGATPRNFNLTPSGEWLIAAGQASNTLASFRVDPTSGELSFTGSVVNVPAPICVLFLPN